MAASWTATSLRRIEETQKQIPLFRNRFVHSMTSLSLSLPFSLCLSVCSSFFILIAPWQSPCVPLSVIRSARLPPLMFVRLSCSVFFCFLCVCVSLSFYAGLLCALSVNACLALCACLTVSLRVRLALCHVCLPCALTVSALTSVSVCLTLSIFFSPCFSLSLSFRIQLFKKRRR